MNDTFDFEIFCDNVLFLRRFAGMGRMRFSRLLGISVGMLKAIEGKREDAPIDIAVLSRLRLLLGEVSGDIFFRRFER